MRIGILSKYYGLPFWTRLQDEGYEIAVYIAEPEYRAVGDAIVPKIGSWGAFVAWLQAKPSIAFIDLSSAGEQVEMLRRLGIPTVGGGKLCDRLEQDRLFGERIAQEVGAKVPPTKSFSTISDTIAFAKTTSDPWYFKSDRYLDSDATYGAKDGADMVRYLSMVKDRYGDRIPNILQKKIEGVAVSTGAWWNGSAFVPPFEGTIEHKKFGNDETGPSTGCSVNVLWYYDDEMPEIARRLGYERLAALLRKHNAPPALYDMNAVVAKDGTPYFLEWTVRMGYDSEATSQRLIDKNVGLGEMFIRLAEGKLSELPVSLDDIAYGVRLGVPPYPWEHCKRVDKHSSVGTPIWGPKNLWGEDGFCGYALKRGKFGLEVADGSGLVGVAVATDKTLSRAHERVINYIKKDVRAPGLTYRTDGAKVLADDAKKITQSGLPIPRGVLT